MYSVQGDKVFYSNGVGEGELFLTVPHCASDARLHKDVRGTGANHRNVAQRFAIGEAMTYILLILFGGGLSAGGAVKVGLYASQPACEVARDVLTAPDTTLSRRMVLCIPIDQPER